MMTDTVLKRKGMDALSETLGLVDAERFISLILREPFDYTEWQQDLYKDVSLDDFYRNVQDFRDNKNNIIVAFSSGRIFKFNNKDKITYKECIDHGLKIGIPIEQLDFPID